METITSISPELMARLRAQKLAKQKAEAAERVRAEAEARSRAAISATSSYTSPALAAKWQRESQGASFFALLIQCSLHKLNDRSPYDR